MADTATSSTKNVLNKTAIYIIIGLIALLLTVIIAGTVLIIYFGNMKVPTKTVIVTNSSQTTSSKTEEFGLLVSLGEKFPIYLQPTEEGVDHYLEVAITLEVGTDEKQKVEVEKRVPMILDLINTVVGSKTKEKIAEKEGKEVLRSEIKDSINNKLGSNIVRNVYFEYFVIQ
jgi:flagellar FliL protein